MEQYDGDPFFRILPSRKNEETQNVSQYVYNVIDISSQYGHDMSMSYTSSNLIGPPSVYPQTRDAVETFLMRTYGPWWNQLPSSNLVKFNRVLPSDFPVMSNDFIEVKFSDRVFPTKIQVYETLNPGAIIKIYGFCYETRRWVILWRGKPEVPEQNEARIFSQKLNPVEFMTNSIRIEFHHQHISYYTEIDAILLHGTLTDELSTSEKPSSFNLISNFLKLKIPESSEPREKTGKQCDFEKLPNEITHLILSYLDLKSLCAASQVSRWFKKLCYDPVLYRVLDLQPYWPMIDATALESLQGRCSSLQCLNLSWCGNRHNIHPKSFMVFLESSCQLLTCLKLSSCGFVNNLVLKTIAQTCQHLQVLELRSCHNQDLTHIGFSQISLIKTLVYLDLYRTAIEKYSLCLIIKSCSKLEHLLLGGCLNILQFNDVAKEIAKHLGNLKTLELWRARSLSEVGVSAIAEQCKNLVEVDLGWCIHVNTNSGCIQQLVRNCTKLKKLFLTSVRTTSDADLIAVSTHSKELEQLDVLGTREISMAAVHRVLESCKNLKLLDISFCQKINENGYKMLQASFPHVQIKRLYTVID